MTDNQRRVADMTGLAVSKSRRGKRSRGKGAKPTGLGTSKQVQHFEALKGAMASGDHASAKLSSLRLANALHSLSKKGKSSLPSAGAKGLNAAEIVEGPAASQGTGDQV